MYITTFLTSNNMPALGKSPTISGWTLDGSIVISGEAMSEVAGGFYAYNFTGYDYTSDYVFLAEETSLPQNERYVMASNEVDSQRNQGITKQILGLVQGNFRMENQTYDSAGRLLTADIRTFDNSTDADLDVDPEFEYEVTATYDARGNLISYKVVQADTVAPATPMGFSVNNISDGYNP